MADVFIRKSSERKGFIREVLEHFDKEIQDKKKIFIKPNIVSDELYPTTTHLETLETILEHLQGKEVVVGDAAAVDFKDSHQAVVNHHLAAVCKKFHVPIIDLYKAPMQLMERDGFRVRMSTVPSTFDYCISLPILKVHCILPITGALKNQFGYFAKWERLKMHYALKDLERAIAEVNVLAMPDLFIVDAIETLVKANEVRHGGQRAPLGYMLAGKDPVALDMVGFDLLKPMEPKLRDLEAKDVGYIKVALQIKAGSDDIEKVAF